MSHTLQEEHRQPLVDLLLAAADDALMLGHRNSDWTGLAPILEEDIAFSAFSQDEMAHALSLYDFVASITEQNADDIAFGRETDGYRCAEITCCPDDFDWAAAIARLFLCAHFNVLRSDRLSQSNIPDLASLASRVGAEQKVLIEHVDDWIVRLGRGSEDAHQRIQKALDAHATQARMLFEETDGCQELEAAGIYPGDSNAMFDRWTKRIAAVLGVAGLSCDVNTTDPCARGGRHGENCPSLPTLLEEMCEVYRSDPGVPW